MGCFSFLSYEFVVTLPAPESCFLCCGETIWKVRHFLIVQVFGFFLVCKFNTCKLFSLLILRITLFEGIKFPVWGSKIQTFTIMSFSEVNIRIFCPEGRVNAWGKAKGQNILILTDEMDIIGILFLLKGKENWMYFLFFKRMSPKGFPKESPVT